MDTNQVEEIKLRATLLGKNKDLLSLHKALVGGGILSESEFFETRKDQLRNQALLLSQKRPSNPSMNAPPITHAEGFGGEKKLVLTPETIKSILDQSEPLSIAYGDLVPAKLSERDFWTFYVSSRFFLDDKKKFDTQNPLESYFKDNLTDSKLEEHPNDNISRFINLSASNENNSNDYSHDNISKNQDGLNIIRKFNNHSTSVIRKQHKIKQTDDSSNIERFITITDLQKQNMNDDENCLEINQSSLTTLENTSNNELVKMQLRHLKLDVCVQTKFQYDLKVVGNSLPQMKEGGNSLKIEHDMMIAENVKLWKLKSIEILRQFWNSYPPGKSVQKTQKCNRMLTILQTLFSESKTLLLPSSALNEQMFVENSLKSLIDGIQFALSQKI